MKINKWFKKQVFMDPFVELAIKDGSPYWEIKEDWDFAVIEHLENIELKPEGGYED